MVKTERMKFKIKDSRPTKIHKSLISQINKTKRELQEKADRKYGRNKLKVSKVYASKVLAERVRR